MRTRIYTTPFTFFMPQELLCRVKTAAASEYKTQSEFVRESIREKIEREISAPPDAKVIAKRYAESSEPLS